MFSAIQPRHIAAFTVILTPTLSIFGGLALAAALPIITLATFPLLTRQRQWKAAFCNDIAWLLYAFLGWLALTMLWSVNVPSSFDIWWRLAALVFFGLAFFHTLSHAETGSLSRMMSISLLVALGFGLLEALTGGFIVKFYYLNLMGRTEYFLHDLNRGACYAALFIWPVFASLMAREKALWAYALLAFTWLSVLPLESMSAVVALAVGIGIYGFIRLLKQRAFPLLMIAVIIGTLFTPTFFYLMEPKKMEEMLDFMPLNARHRLYIWDFAAEKASEHPLLGWGLNSSRHIPGSEQEIWPDKDRLPLHPHNNILQIWLESGIPGVMLFAGLLCLVLWKLHRSSLPLVYRAAAGAQLFSYLSIGLLAFGVWQNWWIAAAFLAAGLMGYSLAPVRRTD